MEADILVGIGVFLVLSGPICSGVQWHNWRRRSRYSDPLIGLSRRHRASDPKRDK